MHKFPTIWLLRHGQTEWNAEKRIQGQSESRLTPLGISQAHRQASLLPGILALNPACYVSPLGRAQETARIALNGRAYITDPRLSEAQAGDWQGLTRGDVQQRWPDTYARCATVLELFTTAPNGEGFDRFHARILDFMLGLSEPAVVVSHGLWGQVMRGIIQGLGRPEMGALSNEQGCIYVLENSRELVLR